MSCPQVTRVEVVCKRGGLPSSRRIRRQCGSARRTLFLPGVVPNELLPLPRCQGRFGVPAGTMHSPRGVSGPHLNTNRVWSAGLRPGMGHRPAFLSCERGLNLITPSLEKECARSRTTTPRALPAIRGRPDQIPLGCVVGLSALQPLRSRLANRGWLAVTHRRVIPIRNPWSLLTRRYRQWHKIALQNHPFLQPGFELALSVLLVFVAYQVVELIGIGLEIEQFKHGACR